MCVFLCVCVGGGGVHLLTMMKIISWLHRWELQLHTYKQNPSDSVLGTPGQKGLGFATESGSSWTLKPYCPQAFHSIFIRTSPRIYSFDCRMKFALKSWLQSMYIMDSRIKLHEKSKLGYPLTLFYFFGFWLLAQNWWQWSVMQFVMGRHK